MALWKERSKDAAAQLIPKGPYPEIIGRLLAARGFDNSNVETVLNPKLSLLKDPMNLKGMAQAVERIVYAYKNKQKLCIYADFDLDGTSGLGILKTALEKLGFNDVAYYQPKRLSEGYGFHPHAVEELKNLGIDLIITVDVGITSHAAFLKAQELGVDVILTDHHLPSETLPQAYCIVNPNQGDCPSQLGYLCGAGVAFYLARALKRAFQEDSELPKNEWDLKELLDLFCIGTLTDMVPLIEDNRVLVKHGMIALQNTQRPGLRALLKALNLEGRPLTSQDVSIKFAPKLNALSRMESHVLPIHIYLEDNVKKAEDIVDQILKNNQTRQSLQSDAETKALRLLQSWSEEDFIFVVSDEFHRGVIGLIATKLAQEFNKPAFVGSKNSEGIVVGSSRLPNGFDSSLVQALQSAQNFLTRFGGHAAAAGFEFHAPHEQEIIRCLSDFYKIQKTNPKEIEIEFDTWATVSEINAQAMKWHDHLGPFGMGFQIPTIRFDQVIISKVSELKGGHLKIHFQDTDMEGLLFSPSEKHKQLVQAGRSYNVLAELQWNYFRHKQSIQLLVKDLKLYET